MVKSKIKNQKSKRKAFTLVEVLVGIALMVIVFLAIYAAFQSGLKVVGLSKNKITATALSNQQIEIIRNLVYPSAGTQGATLPFAEGVLSSTTTKVLNNIEYTIETQIKYIVDEADGTGPGDSCDWDYKRAEVKVSWPEPFGGQIKLATDIAPKDKTQEIQTCQAQPGGILSVSVFDAYGAMVEFPLIEVFNPVTEERIDYATPQSGKHDFPLATSTYKVVVSKSGFSLERTYGTDELANPAKPHPLVLEGQITPISFSIDRTSTFAVDTLSPWGSNSFSDSFLDESKISESSNVVVAGGEVNLVKTPGVYFSQGITDQDLCSFPGINGDCGQSFTMGSQTKIINQVQLYLRKATTTPSDIYLEIRSAGTAGPIMASSTLQSGPELPINFDWITFSLQNSATLNVNTQYFLRLASQPNSTDPGAGAQGPVHWGYASSSPSAYEGGSGWRYIGKNNDPSDLGQELNSVDFSFKIYDDEYLSSGYLISTAISPTNLFNWDGLAFTDSEPFNTELKYQVYYASGTDWLLIPDTDLPGNSTGSDISPLDLSALATTTYSQLKIRANFTTNDSSVSPALQDWQVSWITSEPTSIANLTFLLQGEKVIGTDAGENPVYKYSATSTSDTTGHIDIANLEWDSYTFSLPLGAGLDLVDTNPSPQPIDLSPATTTPVVLYFRAENSLLAQVEDNETLGPIFSASVRLYNLSLNYDKTQYTNEKGQTYFIPLEQADYNLGVEAPGYSSTSTTVLVSGDEVKTIRLGRVE